VLTHDRAPRRMFHRLPPDQTCSGRGSGSQEFSGRSMTCIDEPGPRKHEAVSIRDRRGTQGHLDEVSLPRRDWRLRHAFHRTTNLIATRSQAPYRIFTEIFRQTVLRTHNTDPGQTPSTFCRNYPNRVRLRESLSIVGASTGNYPILPDVIVLLQFAFNDHLQQASQGGIGWHRFAECNPSSPAPAAPRCRRKRTKVLLRVVVA
jgi:hypothetical protein